MRTRRRWPWFFAVVMMFLMVPGTAGQHVLVENSPWNSAYPWVGMVLGVVWQVVDRRDLADRLLIPAFILVLGGLVGPLTDLLHLTTSRGELDVTHTLFGTGVLSGLVLTEQWLRRRDRSRPTVVAPPDEGSFLSTLEGQQDN